jgi:hypothetical protein
MALQVVGCLDIRIRTHEAAYEGVVDTAVHVDDAHLVEMLMHGEAAVYGGAGDGFCELDDMLR